jgi:hypothetical protein
VRDASETMAQAGLPYHGWRLCRWRCGTHRPPSG